MKAADWKRQAAPLEAELNGFRPFRFGFVRFTEWTAEGLMADGSAFDKSAFYMQAFVMPRFVPAASIYFDFGFRVGGRWEAVTPELVQALVAAEDELRGMASLDGLSNAADRIDVNLYHLEIQLCIGVAGERVGVYDDALRRLRRWTPTLPWEQDVIRRCEALVAAVEEGGPTGGTEFLKRRRSEVDRLFA